jgi:predicted metal-dependent phosphoesterase TrpH
VSVSRQNGDPVGRDNARLVDLHCHCSASGGAIGTPADVAEHMAQNGYAAFALTEHDNFESLEQARAEASGRGLEYVPGIEVTVRVDDPDLPEDQAHFLGFGYRVTPALQSLQREFLARKRRQLADLLDALRGDGVADITEEELAAHVRRRFGAHDRWKQPLSLGPIADLLRERAAIGSGENGNNAVRGLLAKYGLADNRAALPDVAEVSTVLKEAGAVRIMAHPFGPNTEATDDERRRLHVWLDRYADGVEIFRPYTNPAYEGMARAVVMERRCPFTGGSDTHCYGPAAKRSHAPYACLQSLREFLAAGGPSERTLGELHSLSH